MNYYETIIAQREFTKNQSFVFSIGSREYLAQ